MTILKKVKGGWINVDHEDLYYERGTQMITQERKSKYKHKIVIKGRDTREHEIRQWCEESYGPGGRSRKLRWRFGWTDKDSTFFFKSSKDAMMFTLRWAS